MSAGRSAFLKRALILLQSQQSCALSYTWLFDCSFYAKPLILRHKCFCSMANRFKPPLFQRPGVRRFLLLGLLVFFVLALWVGSWVLAKMGPSAVRSDYLEQHDASEDAETDSLVERIAVVEALLAELVNEDEARFDQIFTFEKALKGLQRRLLLGHAQDSQVRGRCIDVEQAYHDWQGSRLSKVIIAAEQQLVAALDDGEHAQALEALERAYIAQQTINTNYPKSLAQNTQAAVALARRRSQLAAQPLHSLVEQYVADAQAAQLVADWVAASQSLEASIQAQLELNEEHRDAPQASLERLRALQQALKDLKSQQVERSFQAALSDAEKSFQQGALVEAAAHYARAREIQGSLAAARLTPDIQRAAAFEQNLQTELSQVTWQAIVDGMQQMDVRIRSADYAALAVSIQELAPLFERMELEYAASRLVDSQVQEKFAYIRSRMDDIASIQQRIQSALRPLPEMEGFSLLRTELRQATYRLVMEGQAAVGALNEQPVHSVTLSEALLFCQRLGWLLALPVNLPTESTYRAALQGARDLNLQPYVWCDKDQVKAAQAVAQKQAFPSGFYDLLGNVGEWLATTEGGVQQYKSFGGDFKTRLSSLKSIPIYTFQAETRSRAIGFRIVVRKPSNGSS